LAIPSAIVLPALVIVPQDPQHRRRIRSAIDRQCLSHHRILKFVLRSAAAHTRIERVEKSVACNI
jgi:hypothetical protein